MHSLEQTRSAIPMFEMPDVSPFLDFSDTFYRHVASSDICVHVPLWERACSRWRLISQIDQQPTDQSAARYNPNIQPTPPCAIAYNYARIRRLVRPWPRR